MLTVKELKELLNQMQDDDLIYLEHEDGDFASKCFISDTKVNGKWQDIVVIR